MGQHCSVCRHPKADEINSLLIGSPASKREIAAKFALSEPSVYRHAKGHLAQRVAEVIARHETTNLGKSLKADRETLAAKFHERTEWLWGKTANAVERAETAVRAVPDRESGELRVVGSDLGCIAPLLAQAHKNQELLGRAAGLLNDASSSQAAPASVQVAIVMPRPGVGPDTQAPTITISGPSQPQPLVVAPADSRDDS